jgi:hypothetical protein
VENANSSRSSPVRAVARSKREHAVSGAPDDVSKQVDRFRRAAKKRRSHRDPSPAKRTVRPEQLQATQPVDPEWAEYVTEVLSKRCYFCNFANHAEAAECEQCGNALEIACPECGYPNPNNPEYDECLQCDYPLRIEEFDPRNLVRSSGGELVGEVALAPVIAALVLATFLLLAFSKNDLRGSLIWVALIPVTLIFILIFLYVRAKRQVSDDQDT